MTQKMTVELLWKLGRVGSPVVSRDGTLCVVGVTRYDVEANEGKEQLYRIPLPDAAPVPLTDSSVGASQPAISPDGLSLAFVRKPHGQEKAQLPVMPLTGGEARCVTEAPLGVCDPHWLPNGRGIVFIASVYRDAMTFEGTRSIQEERKKSGLDVHVTEDRVYRFWDHWLTDGEVPHLYLYELHGGTLRDLTPDFDHWWDLMDPSGQFDIAPDSSEVAFAANVAPASDPKPRWAIFTVSTEGGTPICITPGHTGDDVRPRYSPDGRYIVCGSQQEREYYFDRVRLVRYDRARQTAVVLTEPWDASPTEWEFDPQGGVLWTIAEDQGRTGLFRVRLSDGHPERVLLGGAFSHPRPVVGRVYCCEHSLNAPPEIISVTSDGHLEQVTRFNEDLLHDVQLGRVEERTLPGADGVPIQVFLVYPPDFDPTRKWPLVHVIHGGPHGCLGDLFHFRWNAQAMAAPGYVIVMAQFHGSTSYGEDFTRSIVGAWGDKPLRDIEAVTDALLLEPWTDPARMAVTGGSYGGYLTAWVTCQTQRYACAIVHAGVMDLVAKYATDYTIGIEKAVAPAPWDDLAGTLRYSPAAAVGGVSTPTLVLHGEQDYRVTSTQGLAWYNMLKARNVPARLVHYPAENHWILKPKNSIHWYGEFLGWLNRYLGDGASRPAHEVHAPWAGPEAPSPG